jgi:hypothetical protein
MYSLHGFRLAPPGRAPAGGLPAAVADEDEDDEGGNDDEDDGDDDDAPCEAAAFAANLAMLEDALASGSDHPHHIFSTDMALRSP